LTCKIKNCPSTFGPSADIIGRIYAPKLTDTLGNKFVVDNRTGAPGNTAVT
jgi:tripartite-type tricarboxylate transporter receptor subunit TctC